MRRMLLLTVILLALSAGSTFSRVTRVQSAHRGGSAAREALTLVGYRSPWEPGARYVSVAGPWSPRRGWLATPQERFTAEWRAGSWQLFSLPGTRVLRVRTSPIPTPADGLDGPYFEGNGPSGTGVAVARAVHPRPRLARPEAPDRPELRRSTRELLAEYGIPVPAHPRIPEAYRVDLNGDGREEVLWTARSRESWTSPYEEGPGHALPGDYALLGLRYVTPRGVHSVALALAGAGDDCSRYRLFCPLDLNGDGRMEILAHVQDFEEDGLLAFSFDGQRLAGIMGTHLPDEEPSIRCSRPVSQSRLALARAPSDPAPAAAERIVFVRGPDERDGGDIWTVGADGRHERRLTTGGRFDGVAVDGRRIACIDGPWGNVVLLTAPDWHPVRITSGGAFGGAPCWKPGTNELFAGRGTLVAAAGDGGLWRVDVARRTTRRVLPPVDADAPGNDRIRLSPRGTRVASGGGITMSFWVRVLDLRTGRQLRQPARSGVLGGSDFAWLDEDDLLLAGAPGCDWYEHGHWETSKGGIRRVSLRTRHLTRWLFPPSADVEQICRSPQSDRFAVGLGGLDTPASVPHMAARIELIDPRTTSRRPLRLPGPAHLCGFSHDGSRLLLLVLSRTEPATKDDLYRGMKSDAYVVDLRGGACRRVAREAFDAAWMSGSGSPPGPAQLARRRGQVTGEVKW